MKLRSSGKGLAGGLILLCMLPACANPAVPVVTVAKARPCAPSAVPQVSGTWSRSADLSELVAALAAAAVKDVVYVLGGQTATGAGKSSVFRFDAGRKAWVAVAPLPVPMVDHHAVSLGEAIYVFGGYDSVQQLLSRKLPGSQRLYVYHAARDSWEKKADIPTPRMGPATVALNGKIYVLGGAEGTTLQSLKAVEVYDPASDTWSRAADLPVGSYLFGAAAAAGKLYVFGGTQSFHQGSSDAVYVYDPARDAWSSAAPMPRPRAAHSVVELGGLIYVLGGGIRTSPAYQLLFPEVDVYDPVANSWREAEPMAVPRFQMAALAAGRRLWVLGGFLGGLARRGPDRKLVAEVDVFAPAAGPGR